MPRVVDTAVGWASVVAGGVQGLGRAWGAGVRSQKWTKEEHSKSLGWGAVVQGQGLRGRGIVQEDGATPVMSLLRGGEGEPATEDGTAAGLVRGVRHSAPWPPTSGLPGAAPLATALSSLYPTRRPPSILSPFSSLPTSHVFILKVLGPLYSSPGSCDLHAPLYPHGSSRRPGASWLPAAGAQRDLRELEAETKQLEIGDGKHPWPAGPSLSRI